MKNICTHNRRTDGHPKLLELDRGSIRSSSRFGLSTPYRLTIRNSARLFHHVLIYMGDLHLVLPALNLSNLDAGILIMVQQVRLMIHSSFMLKSYGVGGGWWWPGAI